MNKYRVYKLWPFFRTVKADRSYIHQDGSLNFLNVELSKDQADENLRPIEIITSVSSYASGHWASFRKID